MTLLYSGMDYGSNKPHDPTHLQELRKTVDFEMEANGAYYRKLAQYPAIHKALARREPDASWFKSGGDAYFKATDQFEAYYKPNGKDQQTMDASRGALQYAVQVISDNGADLVRSGNKKLNPLLQKINKLAGRTTASVPVNLELQEMGIAFIDSLGGKDALEMEGARECFHATMTALKATMPADEFKALCGRINESHGLEDGEYGRNYCNPKMFSAGATFKSALQLIDENKGQLDTDKNAKTAVTNILAARILTDTKGGKASYLDKTVSSSSVKWLADSLENNPNYQGWLAGMDKDKAARLLRGHGGDLEEDFRKYLKTVPAGELSNDPALRRFMPTAKERIEELQNQVKAAEKDGALPPAQKTERRVKAAAEIIAIRNACQVERGSGFGLDKRIPPASENVRSLTDTVNKLAGNKSFRQLVEQNAALLRDGHGGKLMVNVREAYNKSKNEDEPQDEVQDILNENTVNARIEKLRAKAGKLSQRLTSDDPKEREKALPLSRQVLSEYTYLSSEYMKDNQHKDVSWKTAQATATKGEKKFPFIGKVTKTAQDASELMDEIHDDAPYEFASSLRSRVGVMKAAGQLTDKDIGGNLPKFNPKGNNPIENDDIDLDDDLLE